MCLAIPGKIIEMFVQDSLRMGRIDYGGIVKEACLEWVPEAAMGEYVLVHVGFALNVVDQEDVEMTLRLIDDMQSAGRASEAAAPDFIRDTEGNG